MIGFYLLGDMGTGLEDQYKVSSSLENNISQNKNKDLFICGLGDNIYEEGCNCIDDNQFIKKFEEPYQNINDKIKFYMSLGNHDYGYNLWDLKGNSIHQIDYGIQSQKKGKKWYMPSRYYTFTKGDIDFFVIDTNFVNQTKNEIEDQIKYLVEKLNSSKKKWKILYGHHTLRSVGGHGNAEKEMEDFSHQLLEKSSFDIYMCGHDHNKQLINTTINNKDITLIVCGTGGKVYHKETKLKNVGEGELEFCSGNLGYAYCTPLKDTLKFQFYDDSNNLEYEYIKKK